MNEQGQAHAAQTALRLLQGMVIALGLSACSETPRAAATPAITVRVSNEVLVEEPIRLGVNLGKTYYANDEQYAANPFAHGGFEQGRQTLGIRAKGSTANTVTDDNADPKDPDRIYALSFAGGEYYIATGARAGESGKITGHEANTGVFTLEHDGAPLADGDFVWLRGPLEPRALPDGQQGEQMLGIGDFRFEADKGVTHAFVEDALKPGNHALEFSFPAGGGRLYGGVKHYIRPTPKTTYHVRLRARSDVGGASIGVNMRNYGLPPNSPGHNQEMKPLQGESLTAEWQEFSFEATTYADSTIADNFSSFSIGSALDTAAASPVRVWLDDIRLEDSNAETPSGFIRPAVEAMKEARCGVLRFYGTSSLGSLVEEFTAENTTQAPWSFVSLASFFRFNSTDTVLDQWMELSREVGARPWVNVGSANSPDDWYRLVSYLAAPAEFDDDAKRRAAHGYAAPWTETFDKIYLEIGNEWWNSIFSPYYLWDPVKHGELCKNIIAKVQEHPHLQADKIEIIAGGWAVNAHHWNGVVDATSQGQDSISIAPYLLHKLDNSKTPEDKYRTLFADVDAYLQGPGASTLEDLEKNAKQTSLAIYELNTHLTGGSAGPKVASEICPSLAAGVAVLDKAMALMASMKTNPIVYFTLLQRSFQDRLGLWGVLIRTPDGELRPRPVWQGLRLANQYLIDGPMLKVEVEGSPTWDQPENGSIAETDNVPYIHAYAFRPKGDKERLNVLLINRHLSQPFRMTVVLPFRPAPAAQRVILSGENPADNNEEREQIQVREEKVDNFDGTVTVPACSAVVYQLSE